MLEEIFSLAFILAASLPQTLAQWDTGSFPARCDCQPEALICPANCATTEDDGTDGCAYQPTACTSGLTHRQCGAEAGLETRGTNPNTGLPYLCWDGYSESVTYSFVRCTPSDYPGTMYQCTRTNCQDVPTGVCNQCSQGYYGNVGGSECLICPAGSYCDGGSILGLCNPGYYCPQGSWTANGRGVTSPSVDLPCAAGRYGSNSGNTQVTCEGECFAGYYCEAGSTSPTQNSCDPGTQGEAGQVDSGCSGPCDAGYYCPGNGQNQIACGAVDVYCPIGSTSPQPVGVGYYTVPEGGAATTKIARALAQPGEYASNGVKYTCPEGTYCAGLGLSAISGYCPPGTYCPRGAQTNTGLCLEENEQSAKFYCPGGEIDARVLTVDTNHYTIPEDAVVGRRTGQVACSENELCVDGSRVTRVDWEPDSLCGVNRDQTIFVDEYNGIDAAGDVNFVITFSNGADDDDYAILGRNNVDSTALQYRIESIVADSGCPTLDSDPFALTSTGENGQFLQVIGTQLDYEACTGYTVTVVTELVGDSSTSCSIQVNVVNKNDFPELNSNFLSILNVDEHVDFGLALGPTLFASDVDVANSELSYEIVADYGDAGLGHFRISECSGLLYVNVDGLEGIDFLTKNSYSLKIRACDDGNAFNPTEPSRCTDGYDADTDTYLREDELKSLGQIVINVVDVNDAPVVTSDSFDISEGKSGSSVAADLVVGQVEVADADISGGGSSTSDIHRYSISDPTGTFNIVDCERANNIDVCDDAIAGESYPAGTIFLIGDIDYEFWRTYAIQYTVTVVVQDRLHSTGSLSGSGSFTITILNANDSPTVSCPLEDAAPSCYKFYINENAQVDDAVLLLAGGSDLASVAGEDEDERYDDTSALFYTITGTSVSGVSVDEDIFELTTTPDGVGLKVSIINFPDTFAGITNGPGAGSPIFDFESIASIFVEVTVSDNGKPTDVDSTPAVVMIEVELLPVNEAPMITPGQSFIVSEASCVGGGCDPSDVFSGYCFQYINGDVNMPGYADPDNVNKGGNADGSVQDTLFFSVSGSGDGGNNFDVVVSESGEPCLKLVNELDFETGCNPDCMVLVTVADRQPSTSGLVDTDVVIAYTIEDAPEPPTITPPSEPYTVDETGANGAPGDVLVGTLDITDPDASDQGNLMVSINEDSPSSGSDIFNVINENQLILRAGQLLNYENFRNTYQLTIDVQDNTNPTPLVASAVVTVVVNNVNDAPVMSPQSFSFSQVNTPPSEPFKIGTLFASDEDNPPQALTFVIDSQTADGIIEDTIRLNPQALSELQVDCTDMMCPASARKADTMYVLMMYVQDDGVVPGVDTDNPLVSDTVQVTVTTIEENAVPVAVDEVLTFSLDENTAEYTITDDLDSWFIDADNDVLTFSITQVTPSVITNNDLSVQIYANVDATRDWLQISDEGGKMALKMLANGGFLDFEGISGGSIDISLEVRDDNDAVASMHVILDVEDINEPPTMVAQSRQFNESPTVGGPIGSPLVADDPDTIDANALMWSITNTDGSPSELFTIESSTGQLSINAGAIDYETDPISYELTATVVDTADHTVSNTITIGVVDVNEPPSLSITPGSHCSISEDTVNGTILTACAISATDQENDQLVFTIEDVSLQSIFSVSTNGEVELLQTLDFEARDMYTFDIRVSDGVSSVTSSVTFTVTNVNDVPTPIVDGNIVLGTPGGEAVTLLSPTGVFGPLTTKDGFVHSNEEGGAEVTVIYGPAVVNNEGQVVIGQPTYTASACEIIWTGDTSSRIECQSSAGVGSDLFWQVTIDGDTSALSSESIDYDAPSITSLAGDHQAIPTEGGTVIFTGVNFGPTDSSFELQVLYGQAVLGEDVDVNLGYTSTDCTVTRAHEEVTCAILSGVGDMLRWQVQLGNKKTPIFPSTNVASTSSYIAPSITDVSGGVDLATEGGDTVTLSGTNFGAAVDFSKLLIYYGPPTGDGVDTKYYPSCTLTVPHTEIQCTSTPGSGQGHQWVIIASGLSSVPSSSSTAYRAPVLSTLSGAGALEARTQGGQQIILRGENFGPLIDGTYGTGPSEIVVTYGDDGILQFSAVSCQVTEAHTTISCMTGEGYGFDHQWVVSINGQESAPLDADSSYGVPVVFNYDGAGSISSSTEGGSEVRIEGRNFGNADSAIDSIVYASSDGTTFDATGSCTITINHEEITCLTVPGAGTNLRWTVTIAGQQSEFPTTTYAAPIIYKIERSANSTNGRTDGGEEISLIGENFGPATFNGQPATFLNRVTYGGIDGTKYEAVGCIVQSHLMITCTTAAGVGQDLPWVVQVGLQLSELSTSTCTGVDDNYVCSTSYATPTITSINPTVGLTSGLTTITILGENFGVGANPAPQLSILFDGQAIPVTSSFDRGDGEQGITFVAPECSCVTEHVGSCGTLTNGNAAHLCEVGRSVVVAVDVSTCAEGASDGCTEATNFDYGGPTINTVTVEATGNDATFRLRITGQNFCSTSICGELFVGETEYTLFQSWSHTEIVVIVPARGDSVRVKVGSRESARIEYESVSPRISAETTHFFSNTDFRTEGVETAVVEGSFFGPTDAFSVTIGVCPEPQDSAECHVASIVPGSYQDLGLQNWTVTIEIPEGTGAGIPLKVWRGVDSSDGTTVVNYGPPEIASIQVADDSEVLELATMGGTMITVTGDNFGASFADGAAFLTGGNGALENSGAVTCTGSHTQLTCTTPPGQGEGYDLRVTVDGQQSAVDNVLTKLSFAAPAVNSINFQGDSFPTAGGGVIALSGSNFGIQALGPTVKLDVSICNDCGITDERECEIISFNHSFIRCSLPSGQGSNLNIFVVVSGQFSSQQSQRSLLAVNNGGYDAPVLVSIAVDGNVATRIETETTGGAVVTLTGLNFGECRAVANNGEIRNPWTLVLDGGILDSDAYPEPCGCEEMETSFCNHNNGETQGNCVACNLYASESDCLDVGFNSNGQQSCIEFCFPVYASSVEVLDDLTMDDCGGNIISWDHSEVIFRIPEGQGPNKKLVMTVANQISTFDGDDLLVSYFPPSVTSVVGPYIDSPVPSAVAPNGRTTAGGYEITLLGNSFGVANAVVTIGGTCAGANGAVCMTPVTLRACTGLESTPGCIVSQAHTEIKIIMPPGAGADVDLIINIDGLMSSTKYSYDPPRLTGLSSRTVDANGGLELDIFGYNLGASSSEVNFLLDDVACERAEWALETTTDPITDEVLRTPYIRCRSTPRLPVGMKDAKLTVAYQTSDIIFENFVRYACLDGYYAAEGEYCVFCGNELDTGFVCEDAYPLVIKDFYESVPEALFNLESDLSREQQEEVGILIDFNGASPFAAPGWWRDDVTPNRDGVCPDGLIPYERICPFMRPCEPQASCLGNNTCQSQYDPNSPRCSLCNDGFFRLNGECTECPKHLWLIILAIVLAVLIGAYIAKKLREKNVNWTVISIGVDYFQVLAIFATTNVTWPSGIQDLYDSFSFFNLNLELLAPECWSEVSVKYDGKWAAIMSLPLMLIGLSLFPFFGALFFKRFVQGRRKDLFNHLPSLISNVLIIMYFMYLFITNTALAPFNCQSTTPDDGKTYMQAVGTDAECTGGTLTPTYAPLVPYAIPCLILYTIGFPAFVAFVIFKNKSTIVIDQWHRAKETFPHVLKDENIEVWHFRKSFYILYYQYKPEYYWWIMVVLARKAAISIAALIFRRNTIFQLCIILLVMFCAYAMQVRYRPFMSKDSYEEVVAKYEPLLRRGSLRGPYKNKAKATVNLGDDREVSGKTFNLSASRTFLFNYNTVESVLLFCAVLVNLSGIMFESGQLTNGSSNDALAYLVILLISLSMTYFCIVLVAELLFAFYPNSWLFRKRLEEDDDEGTTFESNNPLMVQSTTQKSAEETTPEDNAGSSAEDLQEMQDIIQQQKDEIKQLQQQLASDNLTKGLGFATKKNEKKKKKNFGGRSQPPPTNVEMSSVSSSHQVI